MGGCQDTVLDQDIRANPINGYTQAETVTVTEMITKSQLTYMVFVEDHSATGPSLSGAYPRLTLAMGPISVSSEITSDMLGRDVSWWSQRKYWLAGCLATSGNSFRFIPVDSVTMENPRTEQGLLCNHLLADEDVGMVVEPFCEGVSLKVRFHDSLTNRELGNVISSVVRVEDNAEQLIIDGAEADLQGEVEVAITQNGQYVVQVEADGGYMAGQGEVNVDCSLSSCSTCHPTLLLPLSPAVGEDMLRLTLGWGVVPENLDLYVVRITQIPCITSSILRFGCPGVSMDMDNMLGGDQGLESITFSDVASQQDTVYMVFVHENQPSPLDVFSGQIANYLDLSAAHVSATDGILSSEITMEAGQYGGETYWLAGCLRLGGNFQFYPVNVFFTVRPDEEVPDLCLEMFGIETTTTTTTTTASPQGWWSGIFG